MTCIRLQYQKINRIQFSNLIRVLGVAYFDRLSNTRYAMAFKASGLLMKFRNEVEF